MNLREEPFPLKPLSAFSRGTSGVVTRVEWRSAQDTIAQRLEALGFIAGATVRVVAAGPLGADPLVVLLGSARFALRRAEASRVLLTDLPRRADVATGAARRG
jgi:ferrous iron transport protein A